MSASSAPSSFPGPRLLFFDGVQQGVRYPEVLYLAGLDQRSTDQGTTIQTHRAAPNVTLFQFPEFIPIRIRLIHFSQRNIHEIVAVDEMAVKSLAILKFNQLQGGTTCCVNQTDSQARSVADYHRFVLGRV